MTRFGNYFWGAVGSKGGGFILRRVFWGFWAMAEKSSKEDDVPDTSCPSTVHSSPASTMTPPKCIQKSCRQMSKDPGHVNYFDVDGTRYIITGKRKLFGGGTREEIGLVLHEGAC